MKTPDFDELIEGVDTPEERDRLRRVHELLVAAGPPAELSPALVSSPDAAHLEDEEPDTAWLPPRRLGAALLVGAALAAASFGAGYVFGNDSESQPAANPPAAPAQVISLGSSGEGKRAGVIRLGRRDANGNWPMVVTVRGLGRLEQGDYYTLALTKKGKPVVTCGTFNTSPKGATTVRMVAAYNLREFDGWVITRYDDQSHTDRVVLTET